MNAAQKKAASNRAKLMWEKRRAKAQGYSQAPTVGVTPREPPRVSKSATPPVEPTVVRSTGDKWVDLPLDEALQSLAALEREVLHARETVQRRTSQLPVILTCWTALHRKDPIPGIDTAYKQCHKDIPDGKWIYRDDCPRDPKTGLIVPVVVCSMVCFNVYMAQRTREKLERRA